METVNNSVGQETLKQEVFFVSVRNDVGSNNRIYSEIIRCLCQDALNQNRQSVDPEYEVNSHDLRLTGSDQRASLSDALIKSKYFVVLLDECTEGRFNPNVLFECGVISTISDAKITFIAKKRTQIPFDIGSNVKIVWISDNLFASISRCFEIDNFDARSFDLNTLVEANTFKKDFKKAFMHSDNPFVSDYEMAHLKKYGFNSLVEFFTKIGIEEYLTPESGMVKYIDGEEDAFRELTEAVKNAKRSLRTSRFAKQSIVNGEKCHKEFMEALKDASYRVNRFDRIICINAKEKWLDAYFALANFCPNKTVIYLRKADFSIKFELVVIDEEVSFIHFYLPDDPLEENETQSDERIRSTLKIVGSKISKKLANIFDRLHHRDYNKADPVELSRSLLGIEEENGELTEKSKECGFLKPANDYSTRHVVLRDQARHEEAMKLICKVKEWQLSEDEAKMLDKAILEYFKHKH